MRPAQERMLWNMAVIFWLILFNTTLFNRSHLSRRQNTFGLVCNQICKTLSSCAEVKLKLSRRLTCHRNAQQIRKPMFTF
jgi:hypothetical protein